METKEAIKLAGTAAELARILGVTRGAINNFGDHLPQGRVWQLQLLKPEWFEEREKEEA